MNGITNLNIVISVLIVFLSTEEAKSSCSVYCAGPQELCLKNKHVDSDYNLLWAKDLAKQARKRAKKEVAELAVSLGK